jgi:serine/threonine-protein kinase HipA
VEAGEGFEHWLLKFDGVKGNKDKELEDPQGYGRIEYAYYKMARDCGIEMSECRLLEENDRHHFMTRRFDRLDGGEKLHMQSLGALAHYDFNEPGAYSYEQALFNIRKLELGMDAVEEQFRRMVFNIVGRNQDDHVKNIAFLMNKQGEWSLSPAFDMTYSFNPTGAFTSSHQMTLNFKQDNFVLDDFKTCAKTVSMKRGRAETIIDEVQAVVSRWQDYADEVGVLREQRDKIQNVLRLEPFTK